MIIVFEIIIVDLFFREACRDLSGRRMRDVNNEKKMMEWIKKKADNDRKKEQEKYETFSHEFFVSLNHLPVLETLFLSLAELKS